MVTPDRRRRAVSVLVERFGVSQRRACRVVGQHRTTQRRPARPESPEDAKLRSRLRRFARNHPRMGWRKAHTVVRREGWCVNHKKLHRLWNEEGLRRPPARKNKKRRPGGVDGTLLQAEYRNHVWGLDFEFDETADLRRLKLLNIVDEHTREALAMDVDRSITADKLVAVLDRLVAERGAPGFIRMDNGPEMIAWVLRDWCRLRGLGIIYIEPGSPWQNPWVESFNGRVRDELNSPPKRSKPQEVAWWRDDDYWRYALYAAVALIRAGAERQHATITQIVEQLADRSGVTLT